MDLRALACWDYVFESRRAMNICLLWVLCTVRYCPFVGLITRPEESYRVWLWSLDIGEALAHWEMLRHGENMTLYWQRRRSGRLSTTTTTTIRCQYRLQEYRSNASSSRLIGPQTFTACSLRTEVHLLLPDNDIRFTVISAYVWYLVMSRDNNAGRSQYKDWKWSLSKGGRSQIFGKNLTKQSSIQEEIMSRFMSGSACYNSVHNVWTSRLLTKNIKNNIYRTAILPVVLSIWNLVAFTDEGT
jgi:hypothetical protein